MEREQWTQVTQGHQQWPLWQQERACYDEGMSLVCGVDEAGAGPLAGDVYAAAVILPKFLPIEGLNDSKKLTERKREALYEIIIKQALAYSIYSVSAAVVDEINILNARLLCMAQAVAGLSMTPDCILVDGNRSLNVSVAQRTIVKGDSLSASIAAASILAKVSRDRYMDEMDELYPYYGFLQHKGYGTKLHYERLREHGPSDIHRRTFLKNL